MYSIAGLVNISRELIWLLLCKTAALMLSGVIRRTISHKIRDIEPGLAGVLSWCKRSIDSLSCHVTSLFSCHVMSCHFTILFLMAPSISIENFCWIKISVVCLKSEVNLQGSVLRGERNWGTVVVFPVRVCTQGLQGETEFTEFTSYPVKAFSQGVWLLALIIK